MPPKPSIAAPYISVLHQHSLMLSHFLQQGGQEISEMLNRKNLTVADLKFTYRQINSWDEHGLLNPKRDGAQWREFSIMDRVWLCLIREMRKYGISLKQIAQIKEFLTHAPFSVNNRNSVLEFYTAHAAPRKHPCVVVIFEDASALISQYSQWIGFQLNNKVPNHVLIHLNPIFEEVFPKTKGKTDYSDNIGRMNDLQLLAAIEAEDFERVEITYAKGKAETLKGLKRVDVKKRIGEVLRENAYQKIEIDVTAGGVTRMLQWKRIKIK